MKQRGISVWLIGYSGAGKSTIAKGLESVLTTQNHFSIVQDADEVRLGLNKGLVYSFEDRKENIRRAAEVSKMLILNEVISINAFICPAEEMRQMLFSIIGRENVLLVYLSTPFEICEKRDVKGMYAKARKGEIKSFTGIDSIFEVPADFDLELDTSKLDENTCIERIYQEIRKRIS